MAALKGRLQFISAHKSCEYAFVHGAFSAISERTSQYPQGSRMRQACRPAAPRYFAAQRQLPAMVCSGVTVHVPAFRRELCPAIRRVAAAPRARAPAVAPPDGDCRAAPPAGARPAGPALPAEFRTVRSASTSPPCDQWSDNDARTAMFLDWPGGTGLFRGVADRLNVVAVGIEHEGAVPGYSRAAPAPWYKRPWPVHIRKLESRCGRSSEPPAL